MAPRRCGMLWETFRSRKKDSKDKKVDPAGREKGSFTEEGIFQLALERYSFPSGGRKAGALGSGNHICRWANLWRRNRTIWQEGS